MMICPVCGPTNEKSWRQCPAYDGQAVCSNCCKKCEFYNNENFRCNWHLKNDKTNYYEEIKKLERRIAALDRETAYYYRRSLPRKAERIEDKALMLRRQKKELEDESV